MLSRREWLSLTIATGAAAAFDRAWLSAQQPLITRAVPNGGERLPIVGLGSSATFSQVARKEDLTAIGEVFKALVSGGGTVFDTAPGYGASEEVAGRVAATLSYTDKIFWATKVNVAGFGGGGGSGSARPEAARAQIDQSFARLKKPKIDLIQVHNLGDIPTQLGILKELKQQFVDAAKRAARIGFDVAELHAGHGYLLHEFLSPISNRRNDEYGGSTANRIRFPLEVFEAVRAVWPQERALGVRVAPGGAERTWTLHALTLQRGMLQIGRMRAVELPAPAEGAASQITCERGSVAGLPRPRFGLHRRSLASSDGRQRVESINFAVPFWLPTLLLLVCPSVWLRRASSRRFHSHTAMSVAATAIAAIA